MRERAELVGGALAIREPAEGGVGTARSSPRTRRSSTSSGTGPREGTLTLVYAARDEEHNDAVVLAELLRAPLTRG